MRMMTIPGSGPERPIHVASKAPWFEIADRLPQLPERMT
jgi:hypothetical protein